MSKTSRFVILLALLTLCATPLYAGSVTVTWDQNTEPDIAGYTVFYGTQSGVYTLSKRVGNVTTWAADNLTDGQTYYFAVQAVSVDGLTSPLSQEVSTTLVNATPVTATPVTAATTATPVTATPTTATPTTATPVTGPISASPTALRFGATKAGAVGNLTTRTGSQTVSIAFPGAGSRWTAAATESWIQLANASGTGAGQFTVSIVNPSNVIAGATSLAGAITITPGTAGVAATTVAVTLTVNQAGGAALTAPFGQVDTPVQKAAGIVGAIGVTGWALDDVGVTEVKIYRNCLAFEPQANCQMVGGSSVVFVGNATFVAGARPDVESAFSTYPEANRAGWGYLLLTNMLPNVTSQLSHGGYGPLQLYAFATDVEGTVTLLGRATTDHTPTSIEMANDSIAKPFGAIDTPSQGQTISGTFANFGWALTPDANTAAGASEKVIPLDGSTMIVYVDGVPMGTVGYNQCRGTVGSPVPAGLYCNDDVANIFGNLTPHDSLLPRSGEPNRYRNLDAGRAAIGAFMLDTTRLTNGMHTLAWGVTDSAGRTDGIGSRYFTVLNSASAAGAPLAVSGTPAARLAAPTMADPTATVAARGDAQDLADLAPGREAVLGRTGFDPGTAVEPLPADASGVRHVRLAELGRLELWLGPVETGYVVANGTLRDLPTGSTFDAAAGRFTWMPGPGYVGTYDLAFVRGGEQIAVAVTIRPVATAATGEAEIRMHVDLPQTGQSVAGAFTVAGWALDPQAAFGSGIGAVHVWAQRRDAPAAPEFLGAATLDGARPDVAQAFGSQFGTAGFGLVTALLAPGQYDLTVFAWDRRTARWEDARTVTVTVR